MNTLTRILPRTGRATALSVAAALIAASAISLAPRPAQACGGFFCSTQPIDQSAERVLYLADEGKYTVHIQISYTGEDDQFSWILPLIDVPQLGIGSDSVFQILEQMTTPQYYLQWQNKPDCNAYGDCRFEASAGGPTDDRDGKNGGGGVEVLQELKVGPYDTVVIKGTSGAELIKWLNDNNYVQPKETEALIDVYAKQDYVFLALKLQSDKAAGDIAPIVLTVEEVAPCLPIRLTKLAASADMPIVTWTLGDHRAIPKNFLHVVLNEATIDWMNPGSNYKNVVSKAVDQAAGHAFVTEYAKKYDKAFANRFASDDWIPQQLEGIKDPGKFLQALMQEGYPRTSQMQDLIRKYIPKPALYKDVSDAEFYNCIQNASTWGECPKYIAAVAGQTFEPVPFAQEIQVMIVEPLAKVQGAFDEKTWLTRLYTTVDPDEMTKDPIFAFNADLPEVDNVHTAQAEPICKPGSTKPHQAILTFANGTETTITLPDSGSDYCWGLPVGGSAPFGKGDGESIAAGGQPALRVEVLDETGAPLVIDPSAAEMVDAQLNTAQVGKKSLDPDFILTLPAVTWDPSPVAGTDSGGGTTTTTSSSGCSAAAAPAGNGLALMLIAMAAGLLVWRRRLA